ncbi:MAG: papain-like cysteine protease family protein [Solirubrobacteraceae bacterium]
MTDNRFLEVDRQVRRARAHRHHPHHHHHDALGVSGMESLAFPFSTTDRVLVVLIDNGGIDLGLPDLVDRLLALVPGANLLPGSVKTGLVSALNNEIKRITRNLLESAELTLNRYSAAKPDQYGDVLVLRDGAATYAELKRTLIAQATASKIVDVVILTHGSSDWISVADGITGDKIRAIKAEAGRALTVRSVYMMNCVGSSLNQAWLDAGAKASAGTTRNNYLPEPTTHFFWVNWLAGQTFGAAVTNAYKQTIAALNGIVKGFLEASPIPGTSMIAGLVDFAEFDFVRDSLPMVQGQQNVTISSDDLTFSQSLSRTSSLVTALLPLSVAKALSEPPPERRLSAPGLAFVRRFEPVADGDKRLGAAQRTITETVSAPLTQNQVDALICFVLGVGDDAFRASTLLSVLNRGVFSQVPDELRKWTKRIQNGQPVLDPALAPRRAAEAELFASRNGAVGARQAVSPAGSPAVSQSMGAVDYAVPGLLAPLQQPSPLTCWATVIAMMTSWRRQQSIAPHDAIAPAGQEFLTKLAAGQGLDVESAGRLYQALGLVAIQSLNPSVDGWDQYLRLYGPQYVDIGYPNNNVNVHAVIVTGISGDGTADGTTITYIDPVPGAVVNRKFRDFLTQYEAPGAVSWPYVITHWPAAQTAGQSLPTNGRYTYESSLAPHFAQQQAFMIAGIAIADAIQIGLGGVAVAQAGVSASAGTFTLTYDKAQRLLTPEARGAMPGAQATTQSYSHRVFQIGASGFANASVIIEWQGNAYGEITTPVIRRDLDQSTDWSHSSCNIAITKLDRIPPADTDPRTWPVVFHYEGSYDPPGNGYWEFTGEFQIDAFGGIKWAKHQVVSRSLIDAFISGSPEDYVRRGADVTGTVAPIPAEQIQYLQAHRPL